MSLLGKVFYYTPKAFGYCTRLAKASPYIIFENAAHEGAKAATSVTRAANESWGQVVKKMVKDGGKAIEKSVADSKAQNGNFFKSVWKSLKETPKTITESIKAETQAVEGFSKLTKGTKGFFKGIGKKMPLIGNILLVAFELPNIISAFREKGIGQGIAEFAKAGTRLTAASLTSAVCGLVFGPIGGIAGFIVGDWLAGKVVGKSYSEQKIEEEEKLQEFAQIASQIEKPAQEEPQAKETSFTSQQTATPAANSFANPAQNTNDYTNDVMMKNINFSALA